jgi:hypothetical protein
MEAIWNLKHRLAPILKAASSRRSAHTSASLVWRFDSGEGLSMKTTQRGFSGSVRALALTISVLAVPAAWSQQSYVGRYDVYGGFIYLNSPKIGLGENGFHVQSGMRLRQWCSLGFDYSISNGDTAFTPDLFPAGLQQRLAAQLGQLIAAGRIPPNYVLSVPVHSDTQTFAAGPQFSYHHWKPITLFIRPSVGAVREIATPRPADPVATLIVAQLAPSGKKQDWTPFYGVGGGADLNLSRHFAVRIQADFVHEHLFSDILKEGRNTVRFSVGPAVQFGRNVVR